MLHAWLYVIIGSCLMIWPCIVTQRLYNTKGNLLSFLYIPVLIVMALLGVMMVVLGAEVLKGNIPITL